MKVHRLKQVPKIFFRKVLNGWIAYIKKKYVFKVSLDIAENPYI